VDILTVMERPFNMYIFVGFGDFEWQIGVLRRNQSWPTLNYFPEIYAWNKWKTLRV
jgi:hypothetical protein